MKPFCEKTTDFSEASDPSARREAETLDNGEYWYRLFDAGPAAVSIHDVVRDAAGRAVDFPIVAANRAFERLLGKKRADFIGKPLGEAFPRHARQWTNHFCRTDVTSEPVRCETADAETENHLECSILDPGNGQRLAVWSNITRCKQLEKQLQHKTRELRRTQRIAVTGSWEFDHQTGLFSGSDVAVQILGLKPDGAAIRPAAVFRVFPPGQRRLAIRRYCRAVSDRRPIDVVFRIGSRQGEERFVQVRATVLYGPTGRVVRTLGALTDVTSIKRAEQRARDNEDRFRDLFREIHSGFALHEILCDENGRPIDYRFLDVNPEFERLLGIEADTIIGRTVREVLPKTEPYWIERYGRVALTGVAERFVEYSSQFDRHFEVVAFCPKPGYFACAFSDITARIKADQELQHSKQQLATILESVNEAILYLSPEMKIYWANQTALTALGKPEENVVGRFCYELWRNRTTPCSQCPVRRTFADGRTHSEELQSPDGRFFIVHSRPVHDVQNNIVGVVETALDVTEKRQLEEQLHHAQKMEAIGRLAGGVAHDFNNLLQVMLGYSEILKGELDEGSPLQHDLQQVLQAGQRAMTLTRQLLTFSRRNQFEPKPADLTSVIGDLLKMLQRVIGEHIDLAFLAPPGHYCILADVGQLEQVFMNLCVNARDAMPHGGRIDIQIDPFDADAAWKKKYPDTRGHRFAVVTVADTGTGIPDELLDRVFEPFFTTKAEGKGTGLGLATVYAIVRRHGGSIEIDNRRQRGTAFKIYLPLTKKTSDCCNQQKTPDTAEPRETGQTILVAEDEPLVRNLATTILRQAGYHILQAADGREAVELYRRHAEEIDLLVFDLIMPSQSGHDAYREISQINPDVPVLFCSGYSDDLLRNEYRLKIHGDILRKPYTAEQLRSRVMTLLQQAADDPAALSTVG